MTPSRTRTVSEEPPEPKSMSTTEDVEVVDQGTEQTGTEYLEFVGTKPYGTEFVDERIIPKGDAIWGDEKGVDLVWSRTENDYLVPTADLPRTVVDKLAKHEGFRLVNK